MRRISYSRGKGKLRHNNREMISKNVDRSRICDNITLVREDLAVAYHKIFDTAVSNYNTKQVRSDRQIDDYFYHLFGDKPRDTVLKNDNKQQSFYEYVVGVGTKDDTGYASNPDMAKKAVACLQEYMVDFQKRNPNFYVFNAVIHQDEATPHLHYDFIPFADGYKQGLSRKQGIVKALEQMGYGKGENAYKRFTMSERDVFRQICEKHGIEVAPEEKGRGYTFTTEEYRNHQELSKHNKKLKEENAELIDKCLDYKSKLSDIDTELSEKQAKVSSLAKQYQSATYVQAISKRQNETLALLDKSEQALAQKEAVLADKEKMLQKKENQLELATKLEARYLAEDIMNNSGYEYIPDYDTFFVEQWLDEDIRDMELEYEK